MFVSDPLSAYRCTGCDRRWYYGRRVCPDCGGTEFETYQLESGKLVGKTIARVTPPDVRDVNPLGVARFDHDVTVIGQLSSQSISIGDLVSLSGKHVLRKDDETVTGPRLKPVTDRPESD